MKSQISIEKKIYSVDHSHFIDISIPLLFDDRQPNHFGAKAASSESLKSADFIGDTRRGGSCNVEEYHLIPHCNGTHTECIGHITDERIAINRIKFDLLIPATLISVEPVISVETSEDYYPEKTTDDLLITIDSLKEVLSKKNEAFLDGLIIRTLPNDASKMIRRYTEQPPPFFSTQAIQFLSELPVRHLLVDMPSLDRMYDEGKLSNHHIFWNVPPESHTPTPQSRRDRTITEMIYVPNEIPDGNYLLSIHIPNLAADAAPSRILLFPIEPKNS